MVTGRYDLRTSYGTSTATTVPMGPLSTGSQLYVVDNVLFPGNDATNYAGGGLLNPSGTNVSYLDQYGLCFTANLTSNPLGQTEINIWGNGSDGSIGGSVANPLGDYVLSSTYNNNGTGDNNVSMGGGGSFTITAVPEPATVTLLGSAMLGLGAVYLRRRGRRHDDG